MQEYTETVTLAHVAVATVTATATVMLLLSASVPWVMRERSLKARTGPAAVDRLQRSARGLKLNRTSARPREHCTHPTPSPQHLFPSPPHPNSITLVNVDTEHNILI